MQANPSRALTLAALAGLAVVLGLRITAGFWQAVALAPLVILLLTGLWPARRWGGWVAVSMIPYVCLTVMDTLTAERRGLAMVSAVLSVIALFAAFDMVRRQRVSLRH